MGQGGGGGRGGGGGGDGEGITIAGFVGGQGQSLSFLKLFFTLRNRTLNGVCMLLTDEISGIFIKSIAMGSTADLDGRINVHDQIIEVKLSCLFFDWYSSVTGCWWTIWMNIVNLTG